MLSGMTAVLFHQCDREGPGIFCRHENPFSGGYQRAYFCIYAEDLKGTEITGTNTMYENTPMKPQKKGDVRYVTLPEKMPLEAGEICCVLVVPATIRKYL